MRFIAQAIILMLVLFVAGCTDGCSGCEGEQCECVCGQATTNPITGQVQQPECHYKCTDNGCGSGGCSTCADDGKEDGGVCYNPSG
jgi:hypothetical protein